MLLEGKKLLVTGVLMDSSIAFHVARLAQEQGAEVVLTSFGRTMKITSTIAKRLPVDPAGRRARRDERRRPRGPGRPGPRARAAPRRGRALHRVRPAGRLHLHGGGLGRRLDRGPGLRLLARVPHQGRAAADGGGRQRRRPHLRRPVRLARLRLDGRGQGRLRVDQPLPRARPRARWGSGATSSRRARSAPRPPSPSPGSSASRRSGAPGRRSAGTSTTPRPPPGRASPCSPTGSPRRPARWCTSTAASTRWASEVRGRVRARTRLPA